MEKRDFKGRILYENEDQLKDGRYRYRYTNTDGKRVPIYAWKLVSTDKTPKGKRDGKSLREKEKEIERDLSDEIDILTASTMTVNDLMQKYFSTKVKLANATYTNYIHLWEKNIKNTTFGKTNASQIKKSDILAFYAYLSREKNFADGTIQLYQNIIYPAFQLAVDDSIIRMNPCKNCMKDYKTNTMESKQIPLTEEEQTILTNFVANDSIYKAYYVLIQFILGTGCRIGEALGITWKDINFEEKYIDINHQAIYKKKDGVLKWYADIPKNKTSRIIPIGDDLTEILKKHKKETYFISKASGFKIDGYSNFVFLNRESRVPEPNAIRRSFHGIVNAYNKEETERAYFDEYEPVLLPEFTPHTLRHTFCTRMAENGLDVKVLQTIMGHKTIAITMQVYNHASVERSKKAVQKIKSPIKSVI